MEEEGNYLASLEEDEDRESHTLWDEDSIELPTMRLQTPPSREERRAWNMGEEGGTTVSSMHSFPTAYRISYVVGVLVVSGVGWIAISPSGLW